MASELNSLKKLAEAQEWKIVVSNGGHLKWMSPTGKVVFTSITPSDHRALSNIRRDLKSAGLIIFDKKERRKR
jgi:hypothetical protein